MIQWRVDGEDTIASLLAQRDLRGISKSVTMDPTEAITVLKDGMVVEWFTEGRLATRSLSEAVQAFLGGGPEIRVLISDTAPIRLTYWLEDPAAQGQHVDGEPFGIPLLTADGELLSAQVNLVLSVDPERSDLLLRAMRGRQTLTRRELGGLLKDQVLAQAIGPTLSQHASDDLRGNADLLHRLWEESKVQLDSSIRGYGLRLDDFYINWGLTQDETNAIEARRHASRLERERHEAEVREVQNQNRPRAPETVINVGRDIRTSTTVGVSGPWIVVIVIAVITALVALVFLLGYGG